MDSSTQGRLIRKPTNKRAESSFIEFPSQTPYQVTKNTQGFYYKFMDKMGSQLAISKILSTGMFSYNKLLSHTNQRLRNVNPPNRKPSRVSYQSSSKIYAEHRPIISVNDLIFTTNSLSLNRSLMQCTRKKMPMYNRRSNTQVNSMPIQDSTVVLEPITKKLLR